MQNLNITPINGLVSDSIFVRFEPTAAIDYSGNIAFSSADAETKYITVTCFGVDEADGFPGTALEFDGTDEFLNCKIDDSFDVGNTFTIEAWIQPYDLSYPQTIFSTSKDEEVGSFQLKIGPGNGGTNRISAISPDTLIAETGNNVISENEWNHIVYTRDGAGVGNQKIYVNGIEQVLITEEDFTFTDNDNEKLIGSKNGTSEFFNGLLDEIRYWSSSGTETEIRENMHLSLSGTETGLVSYWQFNDGSGPISSDAISSNAGILNNMDDSDWIEFTIPFGAGNANTQIVSSTGIVDFSGTDVSMDFTVKTGTDTLVVSEINFSPNIVPPAADEVFDNQYWLVKKYGNGSQTANLTFTLSEDVTAEMESNPGIIKLYIRENISDEGWGLLVPASSADAVADMVTFSNVSVLGQFIIGIETDNSEIVLMDKPLNFEFINNNLSNLIPGQFANSVIVDLDEDGLQDLIVGNMGGTLKYYEQNFVNSTSFTLITDSFLSIDLGNIAAPTFTDLDGDGLLDLLIGENAGNINHYEQNSINSIDFSLVTESFNSLDVGAGSSPAFTDLDGDGLLDLLIGEWDGNIYHYEQNSINSTGFTIVTDSFNSINVGQHADPTFADLDGDGLLDLLIGERDGNINYYEQNFINSTSFSLVTESFNSIDVGYHSSPSCNDIDGDGLPGLLIGNDCNFDYYEQTGIESLEDFGSFLISNVSNAQNYFVQASELTDDLTIVCPAGFTVSLSEESGFTQNLNITPVNSLISDTLFVRFEPATAIEYSGNIVHSSAGAGSKNIAVSGVGIARDGFPGTALVFDGTDDFVNCGNDDSFDAGNTLTIEAWIKPTDLSGRYGIFSSRTNNDQGAFQLEIGTGSGETNRVAVTGVNTWVAQTNDNAVNIGEWNHIVYTRSGSGAGTHTIYVNGVVQTLVDDDAYNFTNNTSDKLIGSGTNGSQLFVGEMDEVRFWSVERTQTEIRENMHLTLSGTETGLVSYWQFNDGSGALTYDFISANNGTLNNTEESNWIISTIPYGAGNANTQVVNTIGVVDFSDTGIAMDFTAKTGTDTLVVSKIDFASNKEPYEVDEVFDNQYWVVHKYGNGSLNTDITFTLSEDITAEMELNPINMKLYTRANNSDESWEFLTSATSVDAASDMITFSNISDFSQFVISITTPKVYLLEMPINFEFVTRVFNGTSADFAIPAFTDLDGDGLLDMLIGEQ
ncbi:MAG: LamG domain-containing protein, partial [Candidatus Cloacimonetes bacterium]|nr:LamG domain-containing protein [Candidatus Cloacimonadota bacterium]